MAWEGFSSFARSMRGGAGRTMHPLLAGSCPIAVCRTQTPRLAPRTSYGTARAALRCHPASFCRAPSGVGGTTPPLARRGVHHLVPTHAPCTSPYLSLVKTAAPPHLFCACACACSGHALPPRRLSQSHCAHLFAHALHIPPKATHTPRTIPGRAAPRLRAHLRTQFSGRLGGFHHHTGLGKQHKMDFGFFFKPRLTLPRTALLRHAWRLDTRFPRWFRSGFMRAPLRRCAAQPSAHLPLLPPVPPRFPSYLHQLPHALLNAIAFCLSGHLHFCLIYTTTILPPFYRFSWTPAPPRSYFVLEDIHTLQSH